MDWRKWGEMPPLPRNRKERPHKLGLPKDASQLLKDRDAVS